MNVNLEDADLKYIDLHEENLENTELQNANLQGTNLKYANLEGAIIYEDNSSMNIDLLIDEKNKRVFKEYGWKIEMQVKKEIIIDEPVEFISYILTRMDR